MSWLARMLFSLMFLASFLHNASSAYAAKFELEQQSDGVTVKVDGQVFTRYLVKSGAKPVLWPLLGTTGREMTRAYPMRDDNPNEKRDHIHQRSCWFTHGSVNGLSFWMEQEPHGTIVHKEFLEVAGGDTGIIRTRNEWLGLDGQPLCEDVRALTFGVGEGVRWFDFDITVKALKQPLTFGDTKEGTFGLRVAESMKVEAKQGGRIVNSEGQADAAAWGKPAAWVDYHGPVEGEQLGVAVLNHPSSFRFPTHWHVRTYGLFAANPFGLKDFTGNKENDGKHTLNAGESMTLRYRVILHKGDEKSAGIAEAYAAYAKVKKE